MNKVFWISIGWLLSFAPIQRALATSYTIPGNVPSGAIDTRTAAAGAQTLVQRIIDTMTFFVFPIAFIGIVYIGYNLIMGPNNPDTWAKSKKQIGYMVIGITLITLASTLVYAFRSVIFGAL